MKRRAFLAAVLALAAWPLTRLRAHENAVKALPKPENRPDRVVLSLWDGRTHVQSLWTSGGPPVRRLTGYPRGYYVVGGQPDGAVFLFRGDIYTQDGDNPVYLTRRYEYVSGPKWWSNVEWISIEEAKKRWPARGIPPPLAAVPAVNDAGVRGWRLTP